MSKSEAEGAPAVRVPLTDAELNMTPEEWAEAFAEDPSCIYTYLRAAEARGLEKARAVIEFYSSGGHTDGSLAREWLAQHPQRTAPQAPTDSRLQVTPEEPTQETNHQRAGTPRTPDRGET